MKPITSAALSALAFGIIGWFVGFGVGFSGLVSSLVFAATGSFFGLLLFSVGAKAFWLPVGGLIVGVALVLAAQLMTIVAFDASYFIFVPLLASVVITPIASIAFKMFPALRKRIFRDP
ncbi:hypothetical protein [Pseudorhodoferax sp.]|uniref:hypothetical protein n=1 Tax=Pseudorhodoferax sp. TaxID=1993553 RepID=UPI0039E28B3A